MSSTNLRFKEVERLVKILDSKHQIHGKGNFPVIEVEPRTLIQVRTIKFLISWYLEENHVVLDQKPLDNL